MTYPATDRPALTEIEITPEMIEAGIKTYVDWENSGGPFLGAGLAEVYLAMEQVRRSAQKA